jgi:RND family efflux transporter MFP subunit
VERGQVLAEIESVLPKARRDEALANLDRARANLAYQEVNLARITKLFDSEHGSYIELADARRARDEAQAAVDALEATVVYTEKVLRDCWVEAPIAGVILERSVEVGDFVAAEGGRGAMANSQFALIADMSKLRVEVDVNELDIRRIYPAMPCVIIPDSQKNRRYDGQVMWIDPGANYAKATVQVKVRIENPDQDLRVEGAAQVQFLTERATSGPAGPTELAGLWIPATAVLPDASGQQGQVFLVTGGRLEARNITIGRRDGDLVEVASGLEEGQEIIAEGLDRLHDGQTLGH